MPIFMTHPDHGATHIGSGELAEHEKNGWKQDTYENWIARKTAPVIEESTPLPVAKGKPGRKPKAE